jgi:hypothetical protein
MSTKQLLSIGAMVAFDWLTERRSDTRCSDAGLVG